jgi:hypothetical protein
MKYHLSAVIFAIAIVVASVILGNAFLNRNRYDNKITVTGLGEMDFSSDLIVWEGVFNKDNTDLRQAYADLDKDKILITEYLISKGIKTPELVFSAVQTNEKSKPNYSQDGRYLGDTFLGYNLTQTIKLESQDVDKVEQISREITELLNQGVQLYSQPPRYYYTKLADLKIEMISKATEDARIRAEKIADHSGAELGRLVSANLGVFQITGQNSGEEYSWGGTFNTASKEKTASITIRLDYQVD